MLQQELVQTRETLAAREAETQELKSRVAELEKLQQQQQQLLAMKDSELAAAQQRLAAAQSQQTQASALPWVIALGVALVVGGAFAWFLRRRDAGTPRFRAPSASGGASLADAFAPKAAAAKANDTAESDAAPAASEPSRPVPPATATPAWHTAKGAQPDLLGGGEVPSAHERLELARAYLDLGDLASARQLLGEITINGDHAARQQAARMLRELE